MTEEMIDPAIARLFEGLGPREPQKSWAERHVFAIMVLALFGFWVSLIAATYLIVRVFGHG